MFTIARLEELAKLNDPQATADFLREYTDSLDEPDRRNLIAMAELKTADELAAMAKAAPQETEAVFVGAAAIIRRAIDAIADIRKAGSSVDVAALLSKLAEAAELTADVVTQNSEAVATPEPEPVKYELPVFSLVGDREVYDTVAKMQRGRTLKNSTTSGWFVAGSKPSENHFVSADLVAGMVGRGLLVPALGTKDGTEPKEFNLSAIAWRCMGCIYTDKTAEIELQVYSVLGTDKDNATARRWRMVAADWRARQMRKDVSPGWNRYAEFPVTLGDKVTGCGTQTVTVIFDSGEANGSGVDHFELYSEYLNDKGYLQVTRSKGTVGKTVSQLAYELSVAEATRHAADKKNATRANAARARVATPKPAAPVLAVLDDGDDAEALAASLGIL